MTEFWVSKPNHWCEYCEVFIRFNLVKKHNNEPKHKRNLEKALKAQRSGRTKEGMEQERIQRELQRLEKYAMGKLTQDVASGVAGSHETKTTFAPPAPRSVPSAPPPPPQVKTHVEEDVVEPLEEEVIVSAPAQPYDPSNPFGAWKESSPVKKEHHDDDDDGKRHDDERFEEDVEEDLDDDFVVKKVVATNGMYNEAVQMYNDNDNNGNDDQDEDIVFKSKSKKDRNARKKLKTRDINDE